MHVQWVAKYIIYTWNLPSFFDCFLTVDKHLENPTTLNLSKIKNPFFCFTVFWGPFLESPDNFKRARKAFVVYMVKLSVNETKWSILLARTRDLILFISIWIFDFGPEKLSGFRRNGPLTTSCCFIFCAKCSPIHETAKKFAWAE